MVTIATNMAGRGTDIKLGEGVLEVGGLKVIGTERHESRRIKNFTSRIIKTISSNERFTFTIKHGTWKT